MAYSNRDWVSSTPRIIFITALLVGLTTFFVTKKIYYEKGQANGIAIGAERAEKETTQKILYSLNKTFEDMAEHSVKPISEVKLSDASGNSAATIISVRFRSADQQQDFISLFRPGVLPERPSWEHIDSSRRNPRLVKLFQDSTCPPKQKVTATFKRESPVIP